MKFADYHNLPADKRAAVIEEEDEIKKSNKKLEPEIEAAYVVVPGHDAGQWGETLIIADVKKGTVVGRISARGRLISHPVVSSNQCSFAVQQQDGNAIGTTHELPSGSLITTFRIGDAGAQDVSFDPIFKRTDDIETSILEPGSKVNQAIAKIAADIVQDVVKNQIPDQPAVKEVEVSPVADPAGSVGAPTDTDITMAPARSSTGGQQALGRAITPQQPEGSAGVFSPELRRKFGL